MKKNYFFFVFFLFLSVFLMSILTFWVVDYFINIEYSFIWNVILYNSLFVTFLVFLMNVNWFLVEVGDAGIKLPFSRAVEWEEIDAVVIKGAFNLYILKTVIFKRKNRDFKVKLFVYSNPKAFCKLVMDKLPWLSEADFFKVNVTIKRQVSRGRFDRK